MLDKKELISFCDKMLYWMIVLLPFAGSFSSAVINSLIGFLIFFFLIKKILTRNFSFQKTVINIPFLFLIVVSIISMRNSLDLFSSLHGLVKLFKYGFLFLIISESVKDVGHLKKITFSIAIGLVLVSLDAVWQLQFGKDFLRNHSFDVMMGLPRLRGSFPHTNLFAFYLGLVLPVIFCLARYFFKNKLKLFFTITFLLGLFCFIFTFSRGAASGLLLAFLLVAFLQRDKRLFAIILVSVFIGCFIIVLVLPATIKEWFKSPEATCGGLLDADRIYIYKTSINMIRHHPLVGVGVNTFCQNYSRYKVNQTYGNTGDREYYGHSNFLHMAGEIGLIGLIIFLRLLFKLFREWFPIYKTLPSGEFLKIFSLGLIAGLVTFLIHGLTDTGLYYSKVATLFWLQIAIILALLGVWEKLLKRGGENG